MSYLSVEASPRRSRAKDMKIGGGPMCEWIIGGHHSLMITVADGRDKLGDAPTP